MIPSHIIKSKEIILDPFKLIIIKKKLLLKLIIVSYVFKYYEDILKILIFKLFLKLYYFFN